MNQEQKEQFQNIKDLLYLKHMIELDFLNKQILEQEYDVKITNINGEIKLAFSIFKELV